VSLSKDRKFLDLFSLVVGIFVGTIAGTVFLVIFTSRSQAAGVTDDVEYRRALTERLSPFAKEAIAGQDNAALQIQAPAGAGPAVVQSVPKNGKELFEQVCTTCHGPGLVCAPKAGDRAAWAPALAEGKASLYQHALEGYTGKTGAMPAKGGRIDLPDALVKQGVDYMVSLVQ
jgi:cytochrome c5